MKRQSRPKGIPLKTLNRFIILTACILYAVMLVQTYSVTRRHHALSDTTDEYLLCIQKAEQLDKASDYLTEQARFYVMNQELAYIYNYFEEVNETQRREDAVESLRFGQSDEAALEALTTAMQYSEQLMEREIYAMKLVTVANGVPDAQLPQELREVSIQIPDRTLSDEEMRSKAEKLLFNENYQRIKAVIQEHTEQCVNRVVDDV